ncbi:type II secretion system F family protein [Roseovarius aestuarii]|uniref:Bacterial type II secretion system protein F domain protein n=1 Tax=Roseovarius aestuarii TaxID=475083 RepID=A0A1X7BY07_9RHOB|nr:type II secretion system F family protein [Roseovarius aestuarii]SMC14463.1 Bacterial type II secretion system protein F domain protein [Roseovarius aestuarii]
MYFGLQEQDVMYVVYSALAVGVLLVFSGLVQMVSRRENTGEAKSRRMRMIARGSTTEELLAILKPKEQSGYLGKLPLVGNLPKTLQQAGFNIRPAAFMFLCFVLFIVVLVVGISLTSPSLAIAAAATLGFLLPLLVVRSRRNQKLDGLVRQLPDALDLMARGLRVGHPLNTSIAAVAKEMPDPIGTEFGIIFDQVNFGDDLTDAFQEFADRVDLEDVHYLSASIGIQHGTGGDLAAVVQTLATVIRNRISMRRKIRAISSEGRLTGWFLSLLPVFIFVATSIMTPGYYGGVSGDALFMPMAAAVVGFTLLNALVLRHLVNFRI